MSDLAYSLQHQSRSLRLALQADQSKGRAGLPCEERLSLLQQAVSQAILRTELLLAELREEEERQR